MRDEHMINQLRDRHMSSSFKKNDTGKLRWTKFAWVGAAKVLRVMHYGAEKYGWDNWRKATTTLDRERYLDAAIRHLVAFVNGEVHDRDSGNPHLWHAACSLLFYLESDQEWPVPVNPISKNGAEILREDNVDVT